MKSLITALFFSSTILLSAVVKGQESSALVSQNFEKKSVEDSTKNTKLKTKSPKGAMIRSLVFPGLGQFYNGQYIKAVIVLAGQSTLIGFSFYYNNELRKSTAALEKSTTTLDMELYASAKAFYRDQRNRMYWFIGAATLLSMLDAYIDAHLYEFDTGPDLALRIGALDQTSTPSRVDFGFSLRANF